MITGITGNKALFCDNLKIFLEDNPECDFKALLRNANYKELMDQAFVYAGLVPISYTEIIAELLYTLTKIDITSANSCLSQYRTDQNMVTPNIRKLKFDVLSLDRDEFFNLIDCDVRELTVYYDDFFGFNVSCRHCKIDTLNIVGGRGNLESHERSFISSQINKTNYN